VDNLHVLPATRGQRLGERLLRSAALELETSGAQGGLHLWVFEANQAALRFYQRLGGAIVERDISRIPAAGGRPAVRLHWPTLRGVGGDRL
jgi:ribosomal protein S18 acetylase RimI-like enzyme